MGWRCMLRDDSDTVGWSGPAYFATTRWSVVLAAGKRSSDEAQQALAALCETYWFPLYTYLRRRGHNAEEAQDLTQEFFSRLIEKNYLKDVKPGKGRFRSYLLVALKHFLADEREKERAQKRGGGILKTFDLEAAERSYALALSHDLTPEKAFERQWATTLVNGVLQNLGREYAASGRENLFEQLKVGLVRTGEAFRQEELAAKLGMTAGAVRTALHRLRRHYGQLLRQTIAHTVAEAGEIDDEIRYLAEVLRT